MVDNTQEDVTCTLDIVSHSSAQTQRLGMRLGDLLRGGELLLLEGQLGSGKTTFTQGLAMGMGISELVSSPTFTLLERVFWATVHRLPRPESLRNEVQLSITLISIAWMTLRRYWILASKTISTTALVSVWSNGQTKPPHSGRMVI